MIKKCIPFFVFILLSGSAYAQNKVTFNVNMKAMLADSLFIPATDQLKISGDIYPLGRGRELLLEDTAPIDSIYSIVVSFSSRNTDEIITYNYFIVRPDSIEREIRPRQLIIPSKDTELPPIPFNAFVR